MAATRLQLARSVNFFVVFLCMIHHYVSGTRLPSDNELSAWAADLKNRIDKYKEVVSIANNEKTYTQELEKYLKSNNVTVVKIDGRALMREMKGKLEQMLWKKMEALENTVRIAEELAANHSWDKSLQKVNYMNTKDPSLLEYLGDTERFHPVKINSTFSAVHIPVEIYEGDIDILNGLKWTQGLDEYFKKNYENDTEILWQYFGSQTGFMRTFPASGWKTPSNMPNGVDLYDVRRRPWYTQGSSSPKDMFILIDTSGSVHGQALQLMKVAVNSILDTLGENDFVRIANFSKAEPPMPSAQPVGCFDSFVQANYRNKKLLAEAVNELKAWGESSFSEAFKYAFEQFKEFENKSREGEGAHCNRIIMLLTDGGTEETEQVFNEYNWKGRPESQRVRVFTYAVGQNPTPTADIRWMACANRGLYSEIPAMGAIRARVQEYVEVIARPLAINHVYRDKWTSSYTGSYGRSWGLGMMTTVTLPVYNITVGSANQTILGVMGIDVTTKKMEALAPTWKLGPNGYTFALNTNGYLIFHPKLVSQGYLEDPPSMDFLDVEVETQEKVQLRKNMIDGIEDVMTLDTYLVSSDQNHVDKERRNYFYAPIDRTSFSLGLSIPEYHKKQVIVNHQFDTNMINDLIKGLGNQDTTAKLIAPWNYREGFMSGENATGTVEELLRDLKQGPTAFKWDEDRIKRLYLDMKMTNVLFEEYLKTYSMSSPEFKLKTVATFVGTYGGLTQVYPPQRADLLEPHRDTWNATYFRRALDTTRSIFSAPYTLLPRGENDTVPPIMVTKAVNISQYEIKEYVIGWFMSHPLLMDLMRQVSRNIPSVYSCNDTNHVFCYLLDDGAFLIASNQEDMKTRVGQFFGKVDPSLMLELDDHMYNKTITYNYQARCPQEGGTTSAAPLAFRIPSLYWFYELLTVGFWNHIWTWSVMNLNIFSWFAAPSTEAFIGTLPGSRTCITKSAQYYFTESADKASNAFHQCLNCNCNCTRDYVATRIEETNLLFIMVTPKCAFCPEVKTRIIQEPVEDSGPDFCSMEPRYRRNPEKCYDYAEGEDTSKCAGPKTNTVSAFLVVVATILTVVLVRMR